MTQTAPVPYIISTFDALAMVFSLNSIIDLGTCPQQQQHPHHHWLYCRCTHNGGAGSGFGCSPGLAAADYQATSHCCCVVAHLCPSSCLQHAAFPSRTQVSCCHISQYNAVSTHAQASALNSGTFRFAQASCCYIC